MYASVSINYEGLFLTLSGRANTSLVVLPDAFNIAEGRGPAGVCCQSVAFCHFIDDRGRAVMAAVNTTFLGIRNSVSKNTYEDLCIGLEILMPYMCKTESGKVIIYDEGYLSCDSYYRSILVNPKTGGAELVIYRKGRFDHRQKPNTREPRKWLNEDIIIKEFPN